MFPTWPKMAKTAEIGRNGPHSQSHISTKLRVAIPSEGVRVAFCSELQKATFYKFPEFAFTFIISSMNC